MNESERSLVDIEIALRPLKLQKKKCFTGAIMFFFEPLLHGSFQFQWFEVVLL